MPKLVVQVVERLEGPKIKPITALFLFIVLSSFARAKTYHNSFWAQGNYLRDYYYTELPIKIPVTSQDTSDFLELIRKQKIQNVYLFLAPFDGKGELPHYKKDSKEVIKFKSLMKASPQTHFIPWIGGVQNKSVFLNSKEWRKNAILSVKRIMEILGTTEVHINFEYLLYEGSEDKSLKYGENFILFFKELKKSVPELTLISTVVASTSSLVTPFKYRHSMNELLQIMSSIHEISFLYYDTKISDREIYKKGMKEQLNDIETLKKKYPQVNFMMGMGTFENGFPPARKYRDQKIEDVETYLRLLKEDLEGREGIIQGISIFSEWLTNKEQWETFQKDWVDVHEK